MNKKFIKFPSIEQLHRVNKDIRYQAQFQGLDEDGNPIMDIHAELPTVTFKGTVKLHGTNAGICYNLEDGLWAQSRKNIITPEKDNAGFAFFVDSKKAFFQAAIKAFASENEIDLIDNTISVYGEWAGEGIQKGVAINEVPKFFAVFGIKVTPHNGDNAFWVNSNSFGIGFGEDAPSNVYHVSEFGEYTIDIDFENVALHQNKLVELTTEVENECPAGKFFGKSGIGEGIVWDGEFKGQRHVFKVKGDKHANSKVKKLRVVDEEKLRKVNEFVNEVCKPWRLEQGVQEVFDTLNGGEPDIKDVRNLIKWVMSDIIKEEIDLMNEKGLEPKAIDPQVSKLVVSWFKENYWF